MVIKLTQNEKRRLKFAHGEALATYKSLQQLSISHEKLTGCLFRIAEALLYLKFVWIIHNSKTSVITPASIRPDAQPINT
jgi:hypothetical protein